MTQLLIIGAGGHSKVVAEAALASGLALDVAFLDDRFLESRSTEFFGKPLLGPLSHALTQSCLTNYSHAVVALGESQLRLSWFHKLLNYGYKMPSVIHPSAIISPSATIGSGSVVFANVVIQSDAHIGDAVILNTSCSVDHDCQLADGVHVSPGANLAGSVFVDQCSWVGMSAAVIQNISIGSNSIVGAGSVVIRDVDNFSTVVGVPARVVRPL